MSHLGGTIRSVRTTFYAGATTFVPVHLATPAHAAGTCQWHMPVESEPNDQLSTWGVV
jgi:hypothetical protein